MKGQCRKRRYFKRQSWGSIRSRLRQRFAKGNFDVEPDDVRPDTNFYGGHWIPSRIREKLRMHPDRFRKIPYIVEMIAGFKGDTHELERRYGLFVPRCKQCGDKADWKYWYYIGDAELFGLCQQCVRPIEKERERVAREQRNARAFEIASRLLPASVISAIQRDGFVTVRVTTSLKIGLFEWTGPKPVEYRLTKDGRIWNATMRQSYCIYTKSSSGWLGYTLGWLDWDRVVEFWLLLRREPSAIETVARKSKVPDQMWAKYFPTVKKQMGGNLVTWYRGPETLYH